MRSSVRALMVADGLEPLAEVEGALLVVEVLHLPHPKLGGLGLSDSREPVEKQIEGQHLSLQGHPCADEGVVKCSQQLLGTSRGTTLEPMTLTSRDCSRPSCISTA